MSWRPVLVSVAVIALLAGACSDGGDEADRDTDVVLRPSVDTPRSVQAECAALPVEARQDRTGATDVLVMTEPIGRPGRLRCAIFDDVDLRDSQFRGVDFAGASFRNADLSGSEFVRANLVGADFTGAVLTNVDFTDSALQGARFDSADVVGTTMGTAAGALTDASFVAATMGCNDLTGAPRMDLTGFRVVGGDADGDGTLDCRQRGAELMAMRMAGTFRDAVMPGFDFTYAVVEATDFAGAELSGAQLTDKGVWPDRSDFTGATLVGADLSGTGFYGARFVGADLSGATLTRTYVEAADFSRAMLLSDVAPADLTDLESVSSAWHGTHFAGATLRGASFFRDDMTGALFDPDDPNPADDLRLVEVICPDGTPSVRLLGACVAINDARVDG
jgi:uncharacterized protein YjbI with pentapeptide repeats